MASPTTVPVTIAPDAAARVAELGMQAELERMVEQARYRVPDLLRVDVVLAPVYDTGDERYITIEITKRKPHLGDDLSQQELQDWMTKTFPWDVNQHFLMWVLYGSTDAG